MSSKFFWNSWAREYRYLWYFCAALFLGSLIFLWSSYFQGAGSVIKWQKLANQKTIDITLHTFRAGPFEINVPAETFVNLEYYNGGLLVPNTTAAYLFLAVLAISSVIIISAITTAEKFWYFAGMTLFILFMVSLRFEVLGLFGIHSRFILAGVLGIYILPSFYFARIRPTTPFIIRLIVFAVATVALVSCVGFFTAVDLPFYHLYLTSFLPGLLLATIFVIIVSHEIIASFVYMVSSGKEKNLKHIVIISVIYLANVVLTGLQEIGFININFIFINVYLLLTVSALLGIWGLAKRQQLFENIIAFYPFGALLFLALGAICFATIGHLIANGNDPGVSILRQMILFTHAGYGLIFLLYILSNFGQVLMDQLNVYKVLYNPIRMPYFTFSLAGFVATIACVLFANWRDFAFKGYAAFYNTAGDLYALLDNEKFAENFYLQANQHSFSNHRSDYVLAKFRASQNNLDDAHYYYSAANDRNATEFSMNNEANIYFWEDQLFVAEKAYRKGLERFPSSGELANNVGHVMALLHKTDSAAYFLNKAREDRHVTSTAEANFFGMAALEYVPLKVDSILDVFGSKDAGTIANALAVATVTKAKFETKTDPLAHPVLDLHSAALLNNYILLHAKELDTLFINKAYAIASAPENAEYSEALKSALAFGFYHVGNVSKAMEILAEQVFLSNTYQGRFNYIMGLWALEQKNADVAAVFFDYAITFNYKDARFYRAIAFTEAGDTQAALAAWDSVTMRGDAGQQEVARRIKGILTSPPSEAVKLPDAEKYQFCRYRLSPADSAYFSKLSNTFNNVNYKAQALLDFSQKCLEADQSIQAIRTYQRIAGLKLTNKLLYEEARHYELHLLASRGDAQGLARQINKGIDFPPSRNLEKMLYTAMIQQANGDTVAAGKNYQVLGRYNPYYEEGILSAYRFFKQQKKGGFYPYTILSDAVQVNRNSIRLLRAFRDEATNMGLDEYAVSAEERIRELESR
jgi:hypothetical protein